MYHGDFEYYATGRTFQYKNYSVKGLELTEEVLEKLFYRNAANWVPGIDRDFR